MLLLLLLLLLLVRQKGWGPLGRRADRTILYVEGAERRSKRRAPVPSWLPAKAALATPRGRTQGAVHPSNQPGWLEER